MNVRARGCVCVCVCVFVMHILTERVNAKQRACDDHDCGCLGIYDSLQAMCWRSHATAVAVACLRLG